MEKNKEEKEFENFYNLISCVLKRTTNVWQKGEGNVAIEIRDNEGKKKAKVSGSVVHRIG